MLLKSFALLFLAVALVAAQDAAEQPARTRTAANRRTKLFEESAQQAEKVNAAGQRRRLVSKTKVSAASRATTAATTTVPTTTTTEAVVVTEPAFQEPEPAVEEQQQSAEEQEPEVPAFRPRPAVPARTQEVQSELPAFRPRSRPAARPVIVEEEEEEVVQTARPRPVAGPTRARAQAAPVSRPQVQVQVAEEAPVRLSVDGKLPRTRTSVASESTKQAPVETVRRYSFENEDGSFTFGYENADGSFKEETRGVDCIVRGKYGYIDPDGVKREFSYQTGNQCVPGQNNEEEEQEADDDDEDERPAPVRRPNVPARRPNVPAERRPNIPAVERRPVNIVQTQDEEEEITQVLNTPTRINRPTNTGNTQRAQAPRPQEQPQPVAPARRPAPVQQIVDFDSEVGRFTSQQPEQRPRPAAPPARPIFSDDDDHDVFVERRPAPPARTGTGLRSFSTELVFDRNTNQFQSALEQRIPETNEEVSIRERLIAFNPFTSTTPAPLLPRVPLTQTQTVQRPQPVQQPQFVPTQNINNPSLSDQERLRQLQEIRRAETEAQRLREERQRIDEQNRQAQNTPAVVFGAPPRAQTFQAPQTFSAPQPQFQFRPVGTQGATSFATGQIDSFLSSLSG